MTGNRPVEPELPVHAVDLNTDGCRGLPGCRRMAANVANRLVPRFIGVDGAADGQLVVATIEVDGLDQDGLLARMRSTSKGAGLRQARKAGKRGYECRPFQRSNFVPDIHAVNTSKSIRSGGEMKPAYLRSVEELGGVPRRFEERPRPECPCHHDTWWGVFEPSPGRRLGEVEVDARLVGYVDFRRIGDFALYSLILGHGDHLDDGIMQALHLEIASWVLAREDPEVRGIRHLMYAGWYQGGDGLRRWKKKMGFEPCYLSIDREQRDGVLEATPAASVVERIGGSSLSRVPLLRRLWRRIQVR